MSNHLSQENSPYLLQHADNPVDWYPWGPEALALAGEQDKPILLSIGYAACHWCHVMAHESFEDQETAAIMNQHFVNIKVDREERPDLDSIYMSAVQAMTGQGGWPLTAMLTPRGEPFYGGTYFPPQPRYGMPSFQQLLLGVAEAWENRREEVLGHAAELTSHIARNFAFDGAGGAQVTAATLEAAAAKISAEFDRRFGGFGGAPKFPPSMTLEFLLRMHLENGDRQLLAIVEETLNRMAYGGIYDQVGGGFARYATDERWLVPHFEKMLYDNALLSRVYLHAWQVTGSPLYRRVVQETLDFVLRELTDEQGGFYSSYDADSEGVEGKFYIWDLAEFQAVVGENASLIGSYFGVSQGGNWEGSNILNVPVEPARFAEQNGITLDSLDQLLGEAKEKLYQVRKGRVWPGLDDKVLTAWNGLMMASFAEAGRLLGRADYTAAAVKNAQFIYDKMRDQNGRLLRSWKSGASAKYNGYLEDYAYLADGLLALYQTVFDERWYSWADELAQLINTHFADPAGGGFYDTSDDHETLLQRPKNIQDNAVPSGSAMALHVLAKLSLYSGDGAYWDQSEAMVDAASQLLAAYPTAFAHWLAAAHFINGSPRELALIGDLESADTASLLGALNETYRPNLVTALGGDRSQIPLLRHRSMIGDAATAYLCRGFSCKLPVTEPATLRRLLDEPA